MKKDLRVKVRENCDGNSWSIGVYEGRKHLKSGPYKRKAWAVKWAKKIAKITGIKYDSEIIKRHGC